jgi:hypothetical protein
VQDQQRSYVDVCCVDHNYEAVDRVFLQVELHKSSIKFGKGAKLSCRCVGPFEYVEMKGIVAYRLALPHSLRHMHNVVLVSVLQHYVSNPTHDIDMSSLQCWMRVHSWCI